MCGYCKGIFMMMKNTQKGFTDFSFSNCPEFEKKQLKTQRCIVPVQRHSLQNMCITEVAINFSKQKKGIEKGMYTAIHTLLINPVFATTPLQAAQMRTVL